MTEEKYIVLAVDEDETYMTDQDAEGEVIFLTKEDAEERKTNLENRYGKTDDEGFHLVIAKLLLEEEF